MFSRNNEYDAYFFSRDVRSISAGWKSNGISRKKKTAMRSRWVADVAPHVFAILVSAPHETMAELPCMFRTTVASGLLPVEKRETCFHNAQRPFTANELTMSGK